jgi:branched-chain amino acid transport system ATP-binding protein
MADPLLSVRALSVFYGAICALREAAFEVAGGEIVCLVGANGAGKSSCLKGIMGLARSTGDIELAGARMGALATPQRVQRGLALVPEGRHVFPAMSVRENLVLGYRDAERSGLNDRLVGVLKAFPLLAERIDQKAGTMSGGEQQMLAIGRALMSGPSVLLLDEPTLGLAPIMVERVVEILSGLRQTGLAIVLAEQNLHMALAIADRGFVLVTGSMTMSGPAAQLRDDPRVRSAYLGIKAE